MIADQFLNKEVPERNIKVVVKAVDIMHAIVMHQVERKSAFVKAFREELAAVGNPAPRDTEFRVYTAKGEMIFSSGNQFGHWREPMKGFNFYAEILAEAHETIVNKAAVDNAFF